MAGLFNIDMLQRPGQRNRKIGTAKGVIIYFQVDQA